MTQRLVM